MKLPLLIVEQTKKLAQIPNKKKHILFLYNNCENSYKLLVFTAVSLLQLQCLLIQAAFLFKLIIRLPSFVTPNTGEDIGQVIAIVSLN